MPPDVLRTQGSGSVIHAEPLTFPDETNRRLVDELHRDRALQDSSKRFERMFES